MFPSIGSCHQGIHQNIQVTSTYNISDSTTVGTTSITLDELPLMKEYDKVNIEVKVVNINPPQVVGNKGNRKQDVILADSKDIATLTLWEKDINSLRLFQSYSFKRIVVREYNDNHYLLMPISGATVDKVYDILTIKDDTIENSDSVITNVVIYGIKELNIHRVCLSCNGKVSSLDEALGCCQECDMVNLLNIVKSR